jgi:c(7)-type cytochrome triheme protein
MRVSIFPADPRLGRRPAAGIRARRLVAVFIALAALTAAAGEWQPIAKDGVHDPRSPAAKLLQEPAEALSVLAPDTPGTGNQVRWVEALDKGQIAPREWLDPKRPIRRRDTDVILNAKGGMPAVRFPHRQHTEWLDCSNCHPAIFIPQKGANQISMAAILLGQKCGACHGRVAFPVSECRLCHSKKKDAATVAAGK